MTAWALWTILGLPAWLAFAALSRWILDNPRADPVTGLFFRALQVYARRFHRLRVVGAEHLPRRADAGPLLVVANHTAGVDPVLVQAACDFEITWMMARDMMPAALNPLWEFAGVIPVNRAGPDSTAARAAIRHLRAGRVVGVFPEGGIERPPRRILPFQPGVGLLVHKTGAPVLQIVIDGAPVAPTAWGSLTRRGRAVLRVLPLRDYAASGLGPAQIADDLRARLVEATGWPTTDRREPATQR